MPAHATIRLSLVRHLRPAAAAVMAAVCLTAVTARSERVVVAAASGDVATLQALSPDITELVVGGEVAAPQLSYIASAFGSLRSLDLSDATVVAFGGFERPGLPPHGSDTLPPMALASLRAAELRLPASLRALGAASLAGSAIESLELPAGIATIAEGALAGCSRLRRVAAPGVRRVEAYAFSGCDSLAEVSLPALERVGLRAFAGCRALEAFDFAPTLSELGEEAFAATPLLEAELSPTSLTAIGPRAFAGCASLASVGLPQRLVGVGEGAFASVALAVAEFSEATDTIAPLAFAGAGSLAAVTLPPTLSTIGASAFALCTALDSIDAAALAAVPALGPDVWEGVECGRIVLTAASDMAAQFLAAPQWREFAITWFSEVDNPAAAAPAPSVRVCFDGALLLVESSLPLESARLYLISGRQVGEVSGAGPFVEARFDTSPYADRLYILALTPAKRDTTSSHTLTLKLLR